MTTFAIKYDTFTKTQWSKHTTQLRQRQLKVLGSLFHNNSTQFIADNYIDYTNGIKVLTDFFDNTRKYLNECGVSTYRTATRISYIECLCLALKSFANFPSDTYVVYNKYYYQLQLKLNIEKINTKANKECGDFLQSLTVIEPFLDKSILDSIKIIIKLLTLIDIESNQYGVLRINDLIQTTICDEFKNEYSYLDLKTGIYTILSTHTKNKTMRTFNVPREFTDYVKQIYSKHPRKSQWLLVKNKYLEKYESHSLSEQFKKITGISYREIRHQFVTYLQNNSTISEIKTVAHNMGHSVRTAMSTYNDNVIEEYIIDIDNDD